jgi:hypothetical protein
MTILNRNVDYSLIPLGYITFTVYFQSLCVCMCAVCTHPFAHACMYVVMYVVYGFNVLLTCSLSKSALRWPSQWLGHSLCQRLL